MRTPSAKANPAPSLRSVINATKKLWRQYHPTFLGHSKLETTQLYAESSTEMLRESYQKALSR